MDSDFMWAVEYSEYSQQKGMYPFHVDTFDRLVRQAQEDMMHNSRGENKWFMVFYGNEEDCYKFTALMKRRLGIQSA